MITTSQFNISSCEQGISLTFGLIRPLKEKIIDVVSVQVINFVVTLTTRNPHTILVNDIVEVVSGGNISAAFVGQKTIISVGPNTVSFIMRVPDVTTAPVVAYLYTVPNIANASSYVLNFSKELSVPEDAVVDILPASYEINGSNNFEPETAIKIFSNFTTSSKTIIKLSITDIYNKVLYTEYKQISCSRLLDIPCEIRSKTVINTEFIYLNRENNWTYQHNGFLIAQFLPNVYESEDDYPEISIRLIKQDLADLPANTNADRLLLTVNPLLIQQKNVTRSEVRDAILENPISASLRKNISINDDTNDWIIQSSALTVDTLKKVLVLKTQSSQVLVEDISVGVASIPKIQNHPIPAVSLLKTIKVTEYREDHIFGQLLYDSNVYFNSNIILYSEDYPALQFTINDYSLYGQEI
jgi:hypothetical protein